MVTSTTTTPTVTNFCTPFLGQKETKITKPGGEDDKKKGKCEIMIGGKRRESDRVRSEVCREREMCESVCKVIEGRRRM